MQQKTMRQKGFTLLEVLIAITILSVALLGLAQLQITGIQSNVLSHSLVTASSIAQSVYEEIEAMDGDEAVFTTAATDQPWPNLPTATVQGGGIYDILYSAVPDFGGVDNLTKVTIKVKSRSEGSWRGRSATMTTLKRSY